MHTPDGLQAFLLVPDTYVRNYPLLEELLQCLATHGVTHGINHAAVAAMVAQRSCNKRVEVAHGNPAQPGVPGRIDNLMDTNASGKPVALVDGRVDHRNINFMINVRKSTPLIRRIPPVAGIDGRTVFGKGIEPPPLADPVLILGNGTSFSAEDPNLVVADTDGALIVLPDGRYEVRNEQVIKGDIDYSTGNIVLAGDLRVKGYVRAGFSVDAEGSVIIEHNVEDARVSARGNIEVRGGAVGSNSGLLHSGGSIWVRHIENCSATAAENITITEDALHAMLQAEGTIKVKSIVGGVVFVGKLLEAEAIGTTADTKTVLDIGRLEALYHEKGELQRRLLSIGIERKVVADELYICVRDGMDESGNLVESQVPVFAGLKEKKAAIDIRKREALSAFAEVEQKIKANPSPVIKAATIFPNTVIKNGMMGKIIKEKMVKAMIVIEENKISITNYT